ncbi:NRF1 [Acanthosepion pharaonis]|uniref:NRF1 n=1 Tax=Acanthosepion pharaonis TaxID=158019 RepID=A0A812E194_ACAPH|nr:NRF1 [Sepia pharaonis]
MRTWQHTGCVGCVTDICKRRGIGESSSNYSHQTNLPMKKKKSLLTHSPMAGLSSHMDTGSIMSDGISDDPSSPESEPFDETDLLNNAVTDPVTSQLANAGPVGVAAAAAIVSGRKRKRTHSFETNPSIRRRQQTRLLRKLKATIEEYTTRVGQQAVVLCCTPGKSAQNYNSFKVFGSQPLEGVLRNCREMVMPNLESALAQQAPPAHRDDPSLHELPPLVIDGIPTPVDKMTQAQLRAFIPLMLKYSTGRGKPGWGRVECRPPWWPCDLPWANVRSDVRSELDKEKVSWTHALRQIVKNCYKHHGREDLLPEYAEENPSTNMSNPSGFAMPNSNNLSGTMVQAINNPDGSVSIIQIDTNPNNGAVVTLADGTQATVLHAVQHEANQAVQTLVEAVSDAELLASGNLTATPIKVDLDAQQASQVAALTEQNGQILLAGNHGLEGIMTIPLSVYQTMPSGLTTLTDAEAQNIALQVAMAERSSASLKEEVPDATHAVEVMTVEQL